MSEWQIGNSALVDGGRLMFIVLGKEAVCGFGICRFAWQFTSGSGTNTGRCMTRVKFSTDMLPADMDPRTKARIWADNVNARGDLDVDCPSPEGLLDARVDVLLMGQLDICVAYSSSVKTTRSARHIRADKVDAITMLICDHERPLAVKHGRSELVIHTGEAVIIDQSVPNEALAPHGCQVIGIAMPRSGLMRLGADPCANGGRIVERSSAPLRLLTGYARQLLDVEGAIETSAGSAASRHVSELFALVMGVSGGQEAQRESTGALAARTALLLDTLRKRACEPDLDADAIGLDMGLAGRSVQHILQQAGLTFTDELRNARVARAEAMLRDVRYDHLSITDVAFACGFSNLSTFYRALTRAGRPSPAELRRRSV